MKAFRQQAVDLSSLSSLSVEGTESGQNNEAYHDEPLMSILAGHGGVACSWWIVKLHDYAGGA